MLCQSSVFHCLLQAVEDIINVRLTKKQNCVATNVVLVSQREDLSTLVLFFFKQAQISIFSCFYFNIFFYQLFIVEIKLWHLHQEIAMVSL